MSDEQTISPTAKAGPDLSRDLRAALGGVRVLARRLVLSTPGVHATVPMLRGVWGAALHDRDPATYATVFEGTSVTAAARAVPEKRPLYVLRPAPPDPVEAPALEWISLAAAVDRDACLLEAWMEAAARGLGPDRVPMAIRRVRGLAPDGRALASGPGGGFRLDVVDWPLPGAPETTPCRLCFDAPLRLVRKGRLIEAPAVPDLAVTGLRRLASLAETEADRARLTALRDAVLAAARAVPAVPWRGEAAHLHRYSANQGEMNLHGVAGCLDLPEGPGPMWPLLAALTWVHVGKGTVFGLGAVSIQALAAR